MYLVDSVFPAPLSPRKYIYNKYASVYGYNEYAFKK